MGLFGTDVTTKHRKLSKLSRILVCARSYLLSLKWCYSITTGSVESLDEWQKSLDDALELCQGDSILGAVTGWVGGMFASSDETEEKEEVRETSC